MKYNIESYKTITGLIRWCIRPYFNGQWYVRSGPFASEAEANSALLIMKLSE